MDMGKKWGMGRAIAADSAAEDEVLCFSPYHRGCS